MHVCLVCRRERRRKPKIRLWLLLVWFTCVPPESRLCLTGVSRLFRPALSPCSLRTNPVSDCLRVRLKSAAGAAEAGEAGEAGEAFQGRLMCPLLCLDALKVHKAGTARALSSTCGRVCLWSEAGPQWFQGNLLQRRTGSSPSAAPRPALLLRDSSWEGLIPAASNPVLLRPIQIMARLNAP